MKEKKSLEFQAERSILLKLCLNSEENGDGARCVSAPVCVSLAVRLATPLFFSSRPPEGRQITQSAFSSLFFPFESVQWPLKDTERHRADHFTLITEYRDDRKNMLFHLKRLAGSTARDV